MKMRIYTMTHKAFDVPPDSLYVPLHVGRAKAQALGYQGDDTGDNISELNCYYSELTGFYWIWKNVKDLDYVGTCHYRRYLIDRQGYFFNQCEYETLLKEYDLITTKRVVLNFSYHYGFSANHNGKILDETGEVIKEKYPDYYDTFIKLVNENETYFGNIMVCKKALFDEYAEWLFSIFFEVQKRVDLTAEDDYHRRVFGFISEFLLYVFAAVKQLKVYECKVGMLGEKAETRELKERLAQYFLKKDIQSAKEYFLSVQKKRPDVLMEASDITGELKLSMQVIATCEQEQSMYQHSILNHVNHFEELMHYFSMLNQITTKQHAARQLNKEENQFLLQNEISEIAYEISKLLIVDK